MAVSGVNYGVDNMKVSELIKELKTVDQDLLVTVRGRDYWDMGWLDDVDGINIAHTANVAVNDTLVDVDVVIIE